jgi:hypothetical protein
MQISTTARPNRNGMTASTKNPHIAMYCKSVTESSAAPASQNTTAAP